MGEQGPALGQGRGGLRWCRGLDSSDLPRPTCRPPGTGHPRTHTQGAGHIPTAIWKEARFKLPWFVSLDWVVPLNKFEQSQAVSSPPVSSNSMNLPHKTRWANPPRKDRCSARPPRNTVRQVPFPSVLRQENQTDLGSRGVVFLSFLSP